MRAAPGASVSTRGPKTTPRWKMFQVLLEVGRVGDLEGREQRGDGARVLAQLHRHLRLHHERATGQRDLGAVLEQAVVREEARQGPVESKLLLHRGHVEADLPADRLGALSQQLTTPDEQGGGPAFHAHGVITTLSASRRSYRA
jgi:hypothetical protein